MCVWCVTNGLQRKEIWPHTNEHTLERHIHVVYVAKLSYQIVASGAISTFIQVNTNAQYVVCVVGTVII